PDPSQSLASRINGLARQLYGVPYYEAGAIPGEIQTLVLHSLGAWMNQDEAPSSRHSYPFDVQVRTQLENYFSMLHYPWFAAPAVFVRPWKDGELIGAGYTLGWSDFDRVNCVALFKRSSGKSSLVAVTHFVPQADLHYAFLPPSPGGDFRFFIYGYLRGKSQPRLSAILYTFDGKELKRLWEKQDLYDGKIDVLPGTVTLRYLVESEYIRAVEQSHFPPGHESIYKVTPQGLALLTEQQIPYREVAQQQNP
ncbi:MAG: hypothetical protein ACRD3O_22480, partial [Terriglobia bacterium]